MRQSKTTKTVLITGLLIAALAALAYIFSEDIANASAPEAKQTPQATPVNVTIVSNDPIQIWNNYSARLEAVDFAEIRPQVSGTITEIKFTDGQEVEEGDLLYVIDPRPYQAAVNQAQADVNAAANQAALSEKELIRAEELIKSDAISKRIYDERESALKVASSSVKSAQARLQRARIDVDYAYVKAPISGRVGRAEIKEGNLVEAGPGAPLLTSIVSTKEIYADFEVDEQTYLKYIRGSARDLEGENKVPVKLKLTGDDMEYKGFIHSFDNRINSSSGTIRARAMFSNEDGALLPGMFASVEMGSPNALKKILVTERAIGTDQNRKFVYVVSEDNKVEYRAVSIGESLNGKRVINDGLSVGDQVIVDGIIRLRPGMSVDPKVKSAELSSPELSDAE